jgi:hypothetical protein
VVQELIDCMYPGDSSDSEQTEDEHPGEPPPRQAQHQLLLLSTAAMNTELTSPKTMQLQVEIQGHKFLFLVDSGSSSCFIDAQKAELLQGKTLLAEPIPVKVAIVLKPLNRLQQGYSELIKEGVNVFGMRKVRVELFSDAYQQAIDWLLED